MSNGLAIKCPHCGAHLTSVLLDEIVGEFDHASNTVWEWPDWECTNFDCGKSLRVSVCIDIDVEANEPLVPDDAQPFVDPDQLTITVGGLPTQHEDRP